MKYKPRVRKAIKCQLCGKVWTPLKGFGHKWCSKKCAWDAFDQRHPRMGLHGRPPKKDVAKSGRVA